MGRRSAAERIQLVASLVGFAALYDLPGCVYPPKVGLTRAAGMLVFISFLSDTSQSGQPGAWTWALTAARGLVQPFLTRRQASSAHSSLSHQMSNIWRKTPRNAPDLPVFASPCWPWHCKAPALQISPPQPCFPGQLR